MVRVKGLEPPRRETLDPKSSASANSATPAYSISSYKSNLAQTLITLLHFCG
jgi:hypothetical protein